MRQLVAFCALLALAGGAAAQTDPAGHTQGRFELRNRGGRVPAESTLRRMLEEADRTHAASALWVAPGDSLRPVVLASSRTHLYPGWQRIVLLDSLCADGCTVSVDGVPRLARSGDPVSVFIGLHQTTAHLEVTTSAGAADAVLRVLPPCEAPLPDLPVWPAPDPENPWWVGTYFGSTSVEGWALPRLGADQTFDRPVLIVEGFDPGLSDHIPLIGAGDMHWEVLWNCTESTYPDTEFLPELLDSLHLAGYDLVFLDFSDGTREVAAQSALVQEVIGLCNAWKVGDAPLVVVGASMGGLIVRHALASLEAAATPACTRLFVALDSPFRGAYLPVALQQAIFSLAGLSASAHAMHEALNTPAARELLAAHVGSGLQDFEALQSLMQAQGLPALPLNLAVSNGRPDGPALAGDGPLLQASAAVLGWEWAHVDLFALPGNPDHPESSEVAYVTCDLEIPEPAPLEAGSLFHTYLATAPAFAPAWESLPGSTSNHLASFAEAVESVGLSVTALQSPGLFIPARSALDLDPWESTGISPFDAVSIQPLSRPSASHCDVKDHLPTLLAWILGGDAFLDTPDSTNALLAYTAAQPRSHWIPGAHFYGPGGVHLEHDAGLAPCADSVVFHAGSSLVIGAPGHPAMLQLHAGAALVLEPGSLLRIEHGSALELHAGATLVIGTADAHLLEEGALVLHEGATLRLLPSSALHCDGETSRIHLRGGRIEVEGQTAIEGAGRLRAEGFSTVSLGAASVLRVRGIHPEHTVVELAESAGLGVYGAGTLHLANGRVRLDAQATCALHARSVWDSLNVESPSAGASLVNAHRMRASESAFRRVNLSSTHASGGALLVAGCTFEDSPWSIDSSGFRFDGCRFVQSPVAAAAVGFPSRVIASTFEGNPGEAAPLLALEACTAPVTVESSQFADASVGIAATAERLRVVCSAFQSLGTGILAGPGTLLSLEDGAFNAFSNNGIHAAFDRALPPLLFEGGSTWGPWNDALLAGTWDASCTNAPYYLNATGNAWWGAVGFGPVTTPLPAISFENPGCTGAAFAVDPAPVLPRGCEGAPGDRPVSDAAFTKPRLEASPDAPTARLMPNPADSRVLLMPSDAWGSALWSWQVYDASGRVVECSRNPATGSTTVDVSHWSPGTYTVEFRCDTAEPARERCPLIVLPR